MVERGTTELAQKTGIQPLGTLLTRTDSRSDNSETKTQIEELEGKIKILVEDSSMVKRVVNFEIIELKKQVSSLTEDIQKEVVSKTSQSINFKSFYACRGTSGGEGYGDIRINLFKRERGRILLPEQRL